MPIIEAIENIAAPPIENPLPDEALSDTAAATVETKSTYTRDRLNQMKIDDLRRAYRAVIPHSDRKTEKHTKAEYATRDFIIEAILNRENQS